ncbi:glycosyltransferase, partial [Candidatus Falkowbacteria bacterium]|nr:glycosyltransferase [Candidatus Falkowbacteria bacterium]
MKIAIISPTFPPYAGGIGNVAYENAKELARIGHEITVFTPLYKPVDEETIAGISVKRIKPLIKYGNAAFLPALAFKLKGFDVIHLHYPFLGGAEVVWLYKLKLKNQNSKIVLHYHMDLVGRTVFRPVFKFHNTFILPRALKMADKIIVTSLDYAASSNITPWLNSQSDKFLEIPNGVDIDHFSPAGKNSALLNKYGI